MEKTKRVLCPLILVASFWAFNVPAQEFPTRLIKVVVPNTPGSLQDTLGRIMATEMSKVLGQPMVVENKAGAGGQIGAEYVVKLNPPDGYTIAVIASSSLSTLPVSVKNLRFDPLKDLPPFIGIGDARFVFGSATKFPWKTFAELVAAAKAAPGKLNFGASVSSVRLPTEALLRGAGVSVMHVPYTSAAPYFQAVIAGEVQMGLINESQAVSFGDRFRVVAVTGDQRSPRFPNAPTMTELGYPQVRSLSYSLNLAAGTPKPIIDKLYAAAARALQTPEIKARHATLLLEIPRDNTPEANQRLLIDDARLYADISRDIGFKPE